MKIYRNNFIILFFLIFTTGCSKSIPDVISGKYECGVGYYIFGDNGHVESGQRALGGNIKKFGTYDIKKMNWK